MRVVLTSGLTGLALLQSGSCGANVQNKYLGQLLPGPGRSSITILPASRQAASPSSVVSCILYPHLPLKHAHPSITRNVPRSSSNAENGQDVINVVKESDPTILLQFTSS